MFFKKSVQVFRPATLLERDSNTIVLCEIWEIFKTTFFYVAPTVAESDFLLHDTHYLLKEL